jgi:arsenite transporter/arsenate reductase (thioredoxin)
MVSMLVLGLQGSPKKSGSSDYLLKYFLAEIKKMGVDVQMLDIAQMNIHPCIGCGYCEKKGRCVIDNDDMAKTIYPLLRKAQVVVASSPVFFYSVTAQLKALIDRTQALWSRKYRFRLSDPLSTTRKGFFLSMGGSRGKKLFDGIHLVATYFFDAIDAGFNGSLTYNGIETPADFQNKQHLSTEISKASHALMSSLMERKRVLFLGRQDDIRTQMADVLMQYHAGSRYHVVSAGENEPAQTIHPGVVEAMTEIGIDVAFHQPRSYSKTIQEYHPDIIISMDDDIELPVIPGVRAGVWDLADPLDNSFELIVRLREQIRENITRMITEK